MPSIRIFFVSLILLIRTIYQIEIFINSNLIYSDFIPSNNIEDNHLRDKYRIIEEILKSMQSMVINKRPDCCDVIENRCEWNLSKNELNNTEEFIKEKIDLIHPFQLTSLEVYIFHKIYEENASHCLNERYLDFIIKSFVDNKQLFDSKYVHLFNDDNNFNVVFIDKNDDSYGFGSNKFGCCGLGHNNYVKTPQKILQLCGKSILQVFNGLSFCMGLTSDNGLFGWGDNSSGQLGLGYCSEENVFLKPTIIGFGLRYIMNVACGSAHTLVLTSNGMVHGWGNNTYGQIGCGKDEENIPIRHSIKLPKIKSIHCSFNQSFALTHKGNVYSWGENQFCVLGHKIEENDMKNEPKIIYNLSNIKSICSSGNNTYFLDNDGDIYFCGKYNDGMNSQSIPKQIYGLKKIKSIHSIVSYKILLPIGCLQDEHGIRPLYENKVLKISKFNTFREYFLRNYSLSHRTINFNV